MTSRTLPYPHQKSPRKSVLGAACALLVACSSGSEPRPSDTDIPSLGDAKLQLERAASCDELLTRIQDSIIVQLALRAEQLKAGEQNYYGPGFALGGVEVDADDASAPPRDASEEAPSGGPVTSGNGSSAPQPQSPGLPGPTGEGDVGAGGASAGGGFSGTTVQVEDVDEADIVKTDGDRIYLLHGGTLFVLRGWPANATELLGSALVEGTPVEMFVSEGKAVVFSHVYGDVAGDGASGNYEDYGSAYTKISVLDVTEATPRVLRESFVEGGYGSSRRHGDVVRAVIQDGFKIPRLDTPSIEYRDAFGQAFPQADIDAQVDAWLERTARSIRSTDLGDWLPRELSRQGSDLVAVAPRCADYYSPDPGLTENGVTSVVSLDLSDVSAPLGGATILGRAERVYANDGALLITQTDYRYTYEAEATEQTLIHRFDIADGATRYTASGAIAGSINDQFSLDERDGIIRVSTTIQPSWRFGVGIGGATPQMSAAPPTSVDLPVPSEPAPPDGAEEASDSDEPPLTAPVDPAEAPEISVAPAPPVTPEQPGSVAVSRVVTLGTDGDTLRELGSTEDFGQTEQIFATRFIGDRGYVVTFRRTDPLFVIDLSDPADPHVVGELHIPGFSNYLFPLDEDHLFAIGQDATADGAVQGLALQVFDVSDPAHPALATKYVYQDLGDSPANVDHRAITFHPERNVVALPHYRYSTGVSTLDVFEISDTSISPVGSVSMSETIDADVCLSKYFGPLPAEDLENVKRDLAANPAWQSEVLASCQSGNQFRRGLFRDDFVYGISNTGVFVYDLTQMGAGAVGEMALPAAVYAEVGYGGGGWSGASTPPSVSRPSPGAPAQGTGGAASSEPTEGSAPASDGAPEDNSQTETDSAGADE